MNWIIMEFKNIPLILCGMFFGILCIFSIVVGLIYVTGRKKLIPVELSDKFMERFSNPETLKKFTRKMGWVTFFVGIA